MPQTQRVLMDQLYPYPEAEAQRLADFPLRTLISHDIEVLRGSVAQHQALLHQAQSHVEPTCLDTLGAYHQVLLAHCTCALATLTHAQTALHADDTDGAYTYYRIAWSLMRAIATL